MTSYLNTLDSSQAVTSALWFLEQCHVAAFVNVAFTVRMRLT